MVTTLALVIGLVVVNVVRPGAGMHVGSATLDTKAVVGLRRGGAGAARLVDFLLHIIPTTVVDAFAKGDILQVLLFSVLFGLALRSSAAEAARCRPASSSFSHVLFGIVGIIMRVAPIGAFGAMAFTIGKYGVGTLGAARQADGVRSTLTCVLFVFVVLGIIARVPGFSVWQFLRYLHEEILIVLGTSSSESALPRMMAKLETLGCAPSVVGLVIPTGYSFNLDGTSIYLTMAALFVAQATNTPLTLGEELGLLARAAADLEGRGGRDRRRLHHARGDAVGDRQRAGRRAGAAARHRSLHVRGARRSPT